MNTEYNPLTERGSGIALPISKAAWHVMAVHTAISREWPLTIDEAIAELAEATNHLTDVQTPESLLSEETITQIRNYHDLIGDAVNTLSNTLSTLGDPDTQITNEHIPSLQDIVTRSWVFLCALDYELAGLNSPQSDPGRLP